MKKEQILALITILITIILVYSFTGYRQLINGNIISPNGIKYTFLAYEGKYVIFGERTFISYIRWQPKRLRHMGEIKTGVYSINNELELTVIYRIKFNSEFYELFIKNELANNNYSFENSNKIKFIDASSSFTDIKILELDSVISNENEIKLFMEHIKNNEIYTDNEWLNFRRNPFNVMDGRKGLIAYIFGFFNDIPNIAFPGSIWLSDDGLYYLVMDRKLYNINVEWLEKLRN